MSKRAKRLKHKQQVQAREEEQESVYMLEAVEGARQRVFTASTLSGLQHLYEHNQILDGDIIVQVSRNYCWCVTDPEKLPSLDALTLLANVPEKEATSAKSTWLVAEEEEEDTIVYSNRIIAALKRDGLWDWKVPYEQTTEKETQ